MTIINLYEHNIYILHLFKLHKKLPQTYLEYSWCDLRRQRSYQEFENVFQHELGCGKMTSMLD